MAVIYNKKFSNLQKVSFTSIEKRFGKVIQATLQWHSIEQNSALILKYPKLPPAVPIQWRKLNDKLRDKTSLDIEVYNDPKDDKRPDEGLPWRLQISVGDETIAIINCKTIEVLPEQRVN